MDGLGVQITFERGILLRPSPPAPADTLFINFTPARSYPTRSVPSVRLLFIVRLWRTRTDAAVVRGRDHTQHLALATLCEEAALLNGMMSGPASWAVGPTRRAMETNVKDLRRTEEAMQEVPLRRTTSSNSRNSSGPLLRLFSIPRNRPTEGSTEGPRPYNQALCSFARPHHTLPGKEQKLQHCRGRGGGRGLQLSQLRVGNLCMSTGHGRSSGRYALLHPRSPSLPHTLSNARFPGRAGGQRQTIRTAP